MLPLNYKQTLSALIRRNRSLLLKLLGAATTILLLVTLVAVVLSSNRDNVISSTKMVGLEVNRNEGIMILNVGLPRSGSLALYEFFTCHGWESVHYCCDQNDKAPVNPGKVTTANTTTKSSIKQRRHQFPCDTQTCGACIHENWLHNRKALDGCVSSNNHVVAQMDVETSRPYGYFLPQHHALPLLAQDYPQAVWVLPERETPERWTESVLHWHSVTQRFLGSFPNHDKNNESFQTFPKRKPRPLLAPKQSLTADATRQALEESVQRAYNTTVHRERRQWLEEVYRKHTRYVLQVAKRYPQIHVLRINVDDLGTGNALAQALGLPLETSASCWKWNAAELDEDWKDLTMPF